MTKPKVTQRYRLIMKQFGQRLREAREHAGFRSAQQFAGALGSEPHTYRKYERGQAEPNYETLTRICELLDVTPNQLLPMAARGKARSGGGGKSDSAAA
jgi:transcriptional regulator with XRE-family HTH domain